MAFNNFPYTDMHELNLDWVIKRQKEADANATQALEDAAEAVDKVDNFIENLDLQQAVDAKLDEMEESGELGEIVSQYIPQDDVIVVTASYGVSPPATGEGEITPFTEVLADYIENHSNRKYYYAARKAAGFANGNLLAVLQTIENQVEDPGRVGIVMVATGGNDVGQDRNDVANGMNAFSQYVKNTYPNAILRFAWLSWRRVSSTDKPYTAYAEAIEMMKELCPRNGFGYCAGSEWIFHQYYDDWYNNGSHNHPSTLGSRYIADKVYDCIQNGSCSTTKVENFESGTFVTRAAASNPVRECAPFTVRQSDNITSIIPGNNPGTPTFRIDMQASYIPEYDPANPPAASRLGTMHSQLVHCSIPANLCPRFPITCLLTGQHGQQLVQGQAYIHGGGDIMIQLVRDFEYQAGWYNEMLFWLPQIDIPTIIA